MRTDNWSVRTADRSDGRPDSTASIDERTLADGAWFRAAVGDRSDLLYRPSRDIDAREWDVATVTERTTRISPGGQATTMNAHQTIASSHDDARR